MKRKKYSPSGELRRQAHMTRVIQDSIQGQEELKEERTERITQLPSGWGTTDKISLSRDCWSHGFSFWSGPRSDYRKDQEYASIPRPSPHCRLGPELSPEFDLRRPRSRTRPKFKLGSRIPRNFRDRMAPTVNPISRGRPRPPATRKTSIHSTRNAANKEQVC